MNKRLATLSFILCAFACFGDIIISVFLGLNYPGYSHARNTLSQLGSNISPVSKVISVWWVVLGSIFVILGILFNKSFKIRSKYTTTASWLLACYGIGEGICSGLFPMNYTQSDFDFVSILHLALSGIGVAAILILPLVLQKVFTKKFPTFHTYSYLAVIAGLLLIGLFTLSKSLENPFNIVVLYKGLWQRLLTINFYVYLMTLYYLIMKTRIKRDLIDHK